MTNRLLIPAMSSFLWQQREWCTKSLRMDHGLMVSLKKFVNEYLIENSSWEFERRSKIINANLHVIKTLLFLLFPALIMIEMVPIANYPSHMPFQVDGMQVFYGDLHNHTSYSDGKGFPSDAYQMARENGLDFFALSDHAVLLTEPEWQDIKTQADDFTSDDEFVGLAGFEWTGIKGHINVFETEHYVAVDDPNYDSIEELYDWLAQEPDSIAQFNHPKRLQDLDFNDFTYDAAVDPRIQLIERTFPPLKDYMEIFKHGWHVGFVQNSDWHSANWGKGAHGTGILAKSLSRADVLEALRSRRTFATWKRGFALTMKANGAWMGSSIELCTPEINLSIRIIETDPSATVYSVSLYDNGEFVDQIEDLKGPVDLTWTPTITGEVGHYYYVVSDHLPTKGARETHASPVWVEPCER